MFPLLPLLLSSGLLAAPPAPGSVFGCAPVKLDGSDRTRNSCGEDGSKDGACELENLEGEALSKGWDEVIAEGDWAFARKGKSWSLFDRRNGKERKLAYPVDTRFHGQGRMRSGLVVLRDGKRVRLEDVAGRVIAPFGTIDARGIQHGILDRLCYLADSKRGCWMVTTEGHFPSGVLAGPQGYLPLDEHLGVSLGRPVSWSFAAPGSGGTIYGDSGKVGWIDSAGRFATRAEFDGFTCVDSVYRPHRAGKWGKLDAKGGFEPKGDLPEPLRMTPEAWRARTVPEVKDAFPMPSAQEMQGKLGVPSVDTFWFSGESRLPDSLRNRIVQSYSDGQLEGEIPMSLRIRFLPLPEGRATLRMECRRIPNAKADRLIKALRKQPSYTPESPLDQMLSAIGTVKAVFAVKEQDWEQWGSGEQASWYALALDSLVDSGKYTGKAWRDAKGMVAWWDDRDPMVVDPMPVNAQERSWPLVELAERGPSGEPARLARLVGSEIQRTDIVGDGKGFRARIGVGGYEETMEVEREDSAGIRIWTWKRDVPEAWKRKASRYHLEGFRWLRKDAKGRLSEDLEWTVDEEDRMLGEAVDVSAGSLRSRSALDAVNGDSDEEQEAVVDAILAGNGRRRYREREPGSEALSRFALKSRRVLHRDGAGRIVRVETAAD